MSSLDSNTILVPNHLQYNFQPQLENVIGTIHNEEKYKRLLEQQQKATQDTVALILNELVKSRKDQENLQASLNELINKRKRQQNENNSNKSSKLDSSGEYFQNNNQHLQSPP